MSILSALKKKFNAKGNNIEEAIKTMEVGGGSSDEKIVVKFKITDSNNGVPTAIEQLTSYTGQELYTAAEDGKNLDVVLYWDRSPVYYSKAINSYFYANRGPIGMSFTFLHAKTYNTEIGTGDYKLLRFYVSYNTTEVSGIATKDL